MSADLLRRAAAKIRETAQAANREAPAPWRADPPFRTTRPADTYDVQDAESFDVGDEVSITSPEARHIALWSPDVADLVASALDGSADLYELVGPVSRTHPPLGLMAQAQNAALFRMLVLARRILGEDA